MKKVVSLITLTAYCLSLLTGFSLPAFARLPVSDDAKIQNTIEINKLSGRITDSFRGKSDLEVVIIQDAHCNYSAQKNESAVINLLSEKYNYNALFLEGAASETSHNIFNVYPHKNITTRIFENYLEQGKISGADFAAVVSKKNLRVFPLEQNNVYRENVEYARKVMNDSELLVSCTDILSDRIALQKEKIFSKEIIEFDSLLKTFKNEVQEQDDSEVCIKFLEKIYSYFDKYSFDLFAYPVLSGLIKGKKDDCDSGLLLEEISRASNFLRSKMLKLASEKKIIEISDYIDLIAKGAKLSMSRCDYTLFISLNERYERILKEFVIDEFGTNSKYYLGLIQDGVDHIKRFYQTVLCRDKILADNLIETMRKEKISKAIISIGGFHADALENFLRDRDISFFSVRPNLSETVHSKNLYDERLLKMRLPEFSMLALFNAFQEDENIGAFYEDIYRAHCISFGVIKRTVFDKLIFRSIEESPLDDNKKSIFIKKIKSFAVNIYDFEESPKLHVLSDLDDSFYASDSLAGTINDFKGDELHIIATGGGGDLKGGILFAEKMLRDLKLLGKQIKRVKVFTSNLKRDRENSVGGLTSMNSVGFIKDNTFFPIEPFTKGSSLYPLNRTDYVTITNVYDEQQLLAYAEAKVNRSAIVPLRFKGETVVKHFSLFENDVVKMINRDLRDMPEFEIIIADAGPGGEKLAEDYMQMCSDKNIDALTFAVDMGGDIIARMPSAMNDNDYAHPEYNVRSPNTDAVFLDMAAYLRAAYKRSVFLAVSALGGDGEIGDALLDYLETLPVEGVFDYVRSFRDDYDVLFGLEEKLKSIPSEVSTNLFLKITKALKDGEESFLDKYKPDFVGKINLADISLGSNEFIRNQSRVVVNVPHYLTTIFFNPLVVKSKIKLESMREKNLGWFEIDRVIRENLFYLTEMNDPNNIFSRLKVNFELISECFSEKKEFTQEYLRNLSGSDAILVKLAALRVLAQRSDSDEIFAEREFFQLIKSTYENKCSDLQSTLLFPVMIYALSGVEIQNDFKELIEEILQSGIPCIQNEYRGFDYWETFRSCKAILKNNELHISQEAYSAAYEMLSVIDENISFAPALSNVIMRLEKKYQGHVPFVREVVYVLYCEAIGEIDSQTPDYKRAKYIFAFISNLFRYEAFVSDDKVKMIPSDIDYLLKNFWSRKASEKIINLFCEGQINSRFLCEKGVVCFKKLTELCKMNIYDKCTYKKGLLDSSSKNNTKESAVSIEKIFEQAGAAEKLENFSEQTESKGIESFAGLVSINGGGGAKVLPDTDLNRFFMPDFKALPVLMLVPSDDDGGSTAALQLEVLRRFNVKLPAMGDFMNAYASFAMKAGNSYVYEFIRKRYATDCNDKIDRVFYETCLDILTKMKREEASDDQWEGVCNFISAFFPLIEKASAKKVLFFPAGHSLGNLLWLLKVDDEIDIFSHKRELTETISGEVLCKVSEFMNVACRVENNFVLTSNLNPQTLFCELESVVFINGYGVNSEFLGNRNPEDFNIESVINKERLEGGVHLSFADRDFVLKDFCEGQFSKDVGFTFLDFDLNDGEEFFVINKNKNSKLQPVIFKSKIKKENGKLYIAHEDSFRLCDNWVNINKESVCVGDPASLSTDQKLWGAKVSLSSNGKVKVILDRTGYGTDICFNNRDRYLIKSRFVAKQTNITESYHLSKFVNAGFVDGKVPIAYKELLKRLRNSKVGCVIGPGSIITSLLPILMVEEIQNELRAMVERGLPVILQFNPLKDNETAYYDVMEILRLFELVCERPVFGCQRGGFITDLYINDPGSVSDEMKDLIENKFSRLRPAERMRGLFYLKDGELSEIRKTFGDDFLVHYESALTVVEKEVRGGVPEKGLGYDSKRIRYILERNILRRLKKSAVKTALYKDVLAIFSDDERKLFNAMLYVSLTTELTGAVEILNYILEEYNKKTKLSSSSKIPKVIVMNFSETVLDTASFRAGNFSKSISDKIYEALNSFLAQGGFVIFITGNEFTRVRRLLFEGEFALPEIYHERIITFASGASEVYMGKHLFETSEVKLHPEIDSCINEVCSVYGIYSNELIRKNADGFLSIPLHSYTELKEEEVMRLNNRVSSLVYLNDEEKEFYRIQWQHVGLNNELDLRTVIGDRLNRIFKRKGFLEKARISGRGSIDINAVNENKVVAEIVKDLIEANGIDESELTFFLGSRAVIEISESFKDSKKIALPSVYPKGFFRSDSVLLYGSAVNSSAQDKISMYLKGIKGINENEIVDNLKRLGNILKKRGRVWPIAPAAAGINIDGEFIFACNDFGEDEHAEVCLMLKVFKRTATKQGNKNALEKIEMLMSKAKRFDLIADLEPLTDVSAELGDPLKDKTLFVTMEPCNECIQKLFVLGLQRICYSSKYFRFNSESLIKELNDLVPARNFECIYFENILPEEVTDTFEYFSRLRQQSGYNAFKRVVRDGYADFCENYPELIDIFKDFVNSRILNDDLNRDLAALAKQIKSDLTAQHIRIYGEHKERFNDCIKETYCGLALDIDETLTQTLFEEVPQDVIDFLLEKARAGIPIALITGRVDQLVCSRFLSLLLKTEKRPSVLKMFYIYPAFGAFGYRLDDRAGDSSALTGIGYKDIPDRVNIFYSELMTETEKEKITGFLEEMIKNELPVLTGFKIKSDFDFRSKIEFFYFPEDGNDYNKKNLEEIKQMLLAAEPVIQSFINQQGLNLRIEVGRRTLSLFPKGVSKKRALDDFLSRIGLDLDKVAKFGDKGRSSDKDLLRGKGSFCVWHTDYNEKSQIDCVSLTGKTAVAAFRDISKQLKLEALSFHKAKEEIYEMVGEAIDNKLGGRYSIVIYSDLLDKDLLSEINFFKKGESNIFIFYCGKENKKMEKEFEKNGITVFKQGDFIFQDVIDLAAKQSDYMRIVAPMNELKTIKDFYTADKVISTTYGEFLHNQDVLKLAIPYLFIPKTLFSNNVFSPQVFVNGVSYFSFRYFGNTLKQAMNGCLSVLEQSIRAHQVADEVRLAA